MLAPITIWIFFNEIIEYNKLSVEPGRFKKKKEFEL